MGVLEPEDARADGTQLPAGGSLQCAATSREHAAPPRRATALEYTLRAERAHDAQARRTAHASGLSSHRVLKRSPPRAGDLHDVYLESNIYIKFTALALAGAGVPRGSLQHGPSHAIIVGRERR